VTRHEIQAIIDNQFSTPEQRANAEKLLATQSPSTEINLPEWWANLARSDANPTRRAKKFADLRERYKNNPEALACFTAEREALKAKRAVYGLGPTVSETDIVAYCYDEEIEQTLRDKGRGYCGTVAWYVEVGHLSPENAEIAAKNFAERKVNSPLVRERA